MQIQVHVLILSGFYLGLYWPDYSTWVQRNTPLDWVLDRTLRAWKVRQTVYIRGQSGGGPGSAVGDEGDGALSPSEFAGNATSQVFHPSQSGRFSQ
jgi:hypothetical protein